jgi:hypothetical protein
VGWSAGGGAVARGAGVHVGDRRDHYQHYPSFTVNIYSIS